MVDNVELNFAERIAKRLGENQLPIADTFPNSIRSRGSWDGGIIPEDQRQGDPSYSIAKPNYPARGTLKARAAARGHEDSLARVRADRFNRVKTEASKSNTRPSRMAHVEVRVAREERRQSSASPRTTGRVRIMPAGPALLSYHVRANGQTDGRVIACICKSSRFRHQGPDCLAASRRKPSLSANPRHRVEHRVIRRHSSTRQKDSREDIPGDQPSALRPFFFSLVPLPARAPLPAITTESRLTVLRDQKHALNFGGLFARVLFCDLVLRRAARISIIESCDTSR